MIFFLYLNTIENTRKNILTIEYENIKNSIISTNYTKDGLELEEKTIDNIDKATNLGLLIFIYDKDSNLVESSSTIEGIIDKTKTGYFNQIINLQHYIFYSGIHKNLKIIVGLSLEIDYKNIYNLAKIIIISFFVTILVSLIFSYIFSKKALSPINKLINDIDKTDIAEGKESDIGKKYLNDEIGILARTFDTFINKVKSSIKREKELYEDINHDLRTPLMVISSSIELLKSGKLSTYQIEKLDMIEDNSTKMKNLVNELLFLNKNIISTSENIDVNMQLFLKNIIQNFSILRDKKGIPLILEVNENFILKTNPLILDKLIGNILKNAISYSERGGIFISVDKNKISIIDSGIGIEKKDLENIWNRFYRIEKSRNNKNGGFGLGLSIVKRILEENNWKIKINSEILVGTEFIIFFD
ncbi:MAG: HAMP domain-containing sensor histidine kinase [Candidatus Gracilibacteria bacterium]|nr:HAMP domain-containing sensor histidine kinase [Candidatus Gracilibacteria bacterium]